MRVEPWIVRDVQGARRRPPGTKAPHDPVFRCVYRVYSTPDLKTLKIQPVGVYFGVCIQVCAFHVHLFQVSLEEALDAITLAGGFRCSKQDDLYYVYKLKKERDPEAALLEMRILRLRYAEVDKVQGILSAIPGVRLVKIHEPSKTVILEDTPENLDKIERVLRAWDRRPRQVMIEAKILEVTLTDDMSLGVDWEQVGRWSQLNTPSILLTVQNAWGTEGHCSGVAYAAVTEQKDIRVKFLGNSGGEVESLPDST